MILKPEVKHHLIINLSLELGVADRRGLVTVDGRPAAYGRSEIIEVTARGLEQLLLADRRHQFARKLGIPALNVTGAELRALATVNPEVNGLVGLFAQVTGGTTRKYV